jgi:hypothetical protein
MPSILRTGIQEHMGQDVSVELSHGCAVAIGQHAMLLSPEPKSAAGRFHSESDFSDGNVGCASTTTHVIKPKMW